MCKDIDCMCYDGETIAEYEQRIAKLTARLRKIEEWTEKLSAEVKSWSDVPGEIGLFAEELSHAVFAEEEGDE